MPNLGASALILAVAAGTCIGFVDAAVIRLRGHRERGMSASNVAAKYLPADGNYSKALSKVSKGLHDQVFNTSKEIDRTLTVGKEQRKVWNEKQKVLKAMQDARLKKITECINKEEKVQVDRKKICDKVREANLKAEEEGGELADEPKECEPGPNIIEMCDQPVIVPNVSQGDYGNELMELVHMHSEMLTGMKQWEARANAEEMEILYELKDYYAAQRVLDGIDEVKAAKEHSLKEVVRMEKVMQSFIQRRTATWVADKQWYWNWGDKANKTSLELCGGNITSLCYKREAGVVKEAEEDTVKAAAYVLYRHDNKSADNSPWALPFARKFLAYLPNETKDINSSGWPYEHSWWQGSDLDAAHGQGWTWDERRANDLVVIDGLETILQTGERYFDYMYYNLLSHLGTRKAQLTELRLQPALLEVGLIPSEPDLSGIELRQKEIEVLHKVSKLARAYHNEEQSRIWSVIAFIDSAARDIDRPDKTLQWCQKTSLRWYKCRQTQRQLMDYMQDSVQFLNTAVKPMRDLRDSIKPGDDLISIKPWVSEPVDEANRRLDGFYRTWTAMTQVEALARGDGNAPQLAILKSKIKTELHAARMFFEPLVSTSAQWSREFQVRQANRIMELMDKKNDHVEFLFYGGGSHMANENRAAYKRMSTPDLWLMNVTGLGIVDNPAEVNADASMAHFLRIPEGLPAPVLKKTGVTARQVGNVSTVLQLLRQLPFGVDV